MAADKIDAILVPWKWLFKLEERNKCEFSIWAWYQRKFL